MHVGNHSARKDTLVQGLLSGVLSNSSAEEKKKDPFYITQLDEIAVDDPNTPGIAFSPSSVGLPLPNQQLTAEQRGSAASAATLPSRGARHGPYDMSVQRFVTNLMFASTPPEEKIIEEVSAYLEHQQAKMQE